METKETVIEIIKQRISDDIPAIEMYPLGFTVIKTDKFNLGFMGRSGSRTIMGDLLGDLEFWPNIIVSFDEFNCSDGKVPNILVLRDPVERAVSGSRLGLHPDYHGLPFLHLIDFDVVTHIIRFEELNDYFNGHHGFLPPDFKKEFEKFDFDKKNLAIKSLMNKIPEASSEDGLLRNAADASVYHSIARWVRSTLDWNYLDVSFSEENNLYKKFLEQKPRMKPSIFKELKKHKVVQN